MRQKCMSVSFLCCSYSNLTALGKLNRFQVQDSTYIHLGIHWPAHHVPRRTSLMLSSLISLSPHNPPGIVAALTWPASLLAVANVIDNPWGVCLHRSAEVGKHLAHILLSRQQVPRTGRWG